MEDDTAEVTILSYRVKVCSCKKEDIRYYMHALAQYSLFQPEDAPPKCSFFSFTETTKDYSLLLDVEAFESLPQEPGKMVVADHVWIPLIISAGPTDTGGISKIAKSVIIPLADEDISVYCVSTYQTDYVLVKDIDLDKACLVLGASYVILREVEDGEEVVQVDRSYVKPTPRVAANASEIARPVTHQLTMPMNKFHIISMPPDCLKQNGMAIMQLMFYASLGVKSSPNQEIFFSFVLVDNRVSLVLDSDCLSQFKHRNQLLVMSEVWRMVKIGDMPDGLGFVKPGIVAQVSEPLADANILEYYISSFYCGHVLVPSNSYDTVVKLLLERSQSRLPDTPPAEKAENGHA